MEQHGKSQLDTNNFRLLALYTDIRLYDTEIREATRKAREKLKREGKKDTTLTQSLVRPLDRTSMLSDAG